MDSDPENQVPLAPIRSTIDMYQIFELIDRLINLFDFLSGSQIIEMPNQDRPPMQTKLKIHDQICRLIFFFNS